MSLLRLDRYQKWRQMSATKLLPAADAAEYEDPLQRSASLVVGQSNKKSRARKRQQHDQNPPTEQEEAFYGSARTPVKDDDAAAAAPHQQALEPTQSSFGSSGSLENIEDAMMVIVATPESRQIMRHISGLGMEDPVTFMVRAQAQTQATQAHSPAVTPESDGKSNPSRRRDNLPPSTGKSSGDGENGDGDGIQDNIYRQPVFRDMKLEDIPRNMRSILSMESDPTARLPPPSLSLPSLNHNDPVVHNLRIGIGLDEFHSSLGRLLTGLHDVEEGEGADRPNKESSAADHNPLADTEQLLRSLPDSGGDSGGAKSRDREASAIEQAVLSLGASLSSLQSLSLEELQKPATLKSSGKDPRLFLEAASSTRSMQMGARQQGGAGGATPSSRRYPQHCQQLSRRDHDDRLHSSMPLNVRIISASTASPLSSTSSLLRKNVKPALFAAPFSPSPTRPHKLRYRAPPSISSLCPLPEAKKAETSAGGAEAMDAKSRSPPGKGGSWQASEKSASAVVVPKMRALPSLNQLFPEDDSDGQPKQHC